MATKAQLENELRSALIQSINNMIEQEYQTDALPVSTSELAVPLLDSNGNEAWAIIKVSIPRGTRNGNGGYIPYDGYAISEIYKEEMEEKQKKKKGKES